MGKKVNWGILGCAAIAKNRVIPGLLKADNACLYAVASRGQEKLAEFSELFPIEKTYEAYEELLADSKVDAVYIPLPNMGNIRMQRELGGGAFYDMACYDISVISYLLGKMPVQAKALAEIDDTHGVDVSNTFLLKYEDGTQAAGYSSLNSYARGYYALVGEKGRIEVPCNFNCRNICKFTVMVNGIVDNVEIKDEECTEYTVLCPDNYMLEIAQFSRCVLGEEPPYITEEETVGNARILDMILEAAG